MANVKISDLPAASTPLTGTELVPIVQSGVTSQTTVDALLAEQAGSSFVGYLPSGGIATTVQAKLRENINITDFGADPTGVTDSTQAIKNAIDACPSNGTIYCPSGTYKVNASFSTPITIYKRINFNAWDAKFVHDGVSTGYIFSIQKTASTPTSDCNFNGQLEYVGFSAKIYGATEQQANTATDTRTSIATPLALRGGTDGLNIRLHAEWFKGAGLLFTGEGSVRESVFDLDIRYCGYQTTNVAALHIIPVNSGDGHNQLTFSRVRLVFAKWRMIHMVGGATAGPQKTRVVYFDDIQIEQAAVSDSYWNTPPQVEMIWIEESGEGGTHFLQGDILNPYSTSTTLWGYPAVRLGNKDSAYSCDRISFTRIFIRNADSTGAIGILCENISVLQIAAGCSIWLSSVSQKRSVVVGKTNAADSYETISTPATVTNVFVDPTCDVYAEPYYADSSYQYSTVGKIVNTTTSGLNQQFINNGGFTSGKAVISAIPSTGTTSTTVFFNGLAPTGTPLDDFAGTTHLINVSASKSLSSTVTISNASPGVVTWTGHGLQNGDQVSFTTTGSLPTGLSAATGYFVVNSATNTFQVSATSGGAAINTSSAGSGVHTCAFFAMANIVLLLNILDKNHVANVTTISNVNNNSNLSITAGTYGSLTAGTFSDSNGIKFQLNVTNNTGYAVDANLYTTRLGS